MKKLKINLILLFIIVCKSSSAQFSIDVYSGYNHSKEEYKLPFNRSRFISYYTGNIRDTMVNYFDGTEFVIYEMQSVLSDNSLPTYNFTANYVYGLNIQYAYANYLKTGFSFETHGLHKNANSFIIERYTYKYSHESMHEDSLIYSYDGDIDLSYNTFSASFIQTFCYPYKRFNFYADFGVSFYNFILNYENIVYRKKHAHEYSRGDAFESNEKHNNRYEGHSFGIKTALGVSYELFDNISVFGSVGYAKANLQIRKGTYVSSEGLPDLSDVIEDYEPPSFPMEIPDDRMPDFDIINYNSWNFRLGLRYTFGK